MVGVSFDELVCNCGKTKIFPPIPCGLTSPECSFPCIRDTDCGHPIVPHTCHDDETSCPPCMYFTERQWYN